MFASRSIAPNRKTGQVRAAAFVVAALLTGALAACGSSGSSATGGISTGGITASGSATGGATPTSTSPAPVVTVTTTVTASAAPTYYFADGKVYDVWITAVNKDGTFVIDIAKHLTGQTAKTYLTSHGGTIPPAGIPNDYINVDTYVKKTVALSDSATITVFNDSGPTPMSVSAFRSYVPTHLAQPVPPSTYDTWQGAPHWYGPIYEATFSHDSIVKLSEIFEP